MRNKEKLKEKRRSGYDRGVAKHLARCKPRVLVKKDEKGNVVGRYSVASCAREHGLTPVSMPESFRLTAEAAS